MNEPGYSLILCHHGIKGQKWGVRRYQNEDGTLTDAGRKRYAKDLYKEVSKDYKKYGPTEAHQRINSVIAKDKRVQDYLSSHKDEYRRLSDANYKTNEAYENAYNEKIDKYYQQALKTGKDEDSDDFYSWVEEMAANDKDISKVSLAYSKTLKELKAYENTGKSVAEDLLGKYGSKTLKSSWDYGDSDTAQSAVYNEIKRLLYKEAYGYSY